MINIPYYFQLEGLDTLSNDIALKLIGNQNLFRLLKYEGSNCLDSSLPDVTEDEMYKMFDHNDDENIRILFQPWTSVTTTTRKSELRIYLSNINRKSKDNVVLMELCIGFQVITHVQDSYIDGGISRPVRIMQEVIKILNGQDINKIGVLTFSPTRNDCGIYKFADMWAGYMFYMYTNTD